MAQRVRALAIARLLRPLAISRSTSTSQADSAAGQLSRQFFSPSSSSARRLASAGGQHESRRGIGVEWVLPTRTQRNLGVPSRLLARWCIVPLACSQASPTALLDRGKASGLRSQVVMTTAGIRPTFWRVQRGSVLHPNSEHRDAADPELPTHSLLVHASNS
jgi:hypothetical protein